jgi:hypothetical protein
MPKFEHIEDAEAWYSERLTNAHLYPNQRTWLIKLALRLCAICRKRGMEW